MIGTDKAECGKKVWHANKHNPSPFHPPATSPCLGSYCQAPQRILWEDPLPEPHNTTWKKCCPAHPWPHGHQLALSYLPCRFRLLQDHAFSAPHEVLVTLPQAPPPLLPTASMTDFLHVNCFVSGWRTLLHEAAGTRGWQSPFLHHTHLLPSAAFLRLRQTSLMDHSIKVDVGEKAFCHGRNQATHGNKPSVCKFLL